MARRPVKKFTIEEIENRAIHKKHLHQSELLDAIDESPEFHDPYSELNLFLSQKIKREMRHCSNSKKWSPQLQDELLSKITPEFQQRYPRYRLGISALKKTWERVQYFSAQIQGEKEALTQDGKLNIPFFIKENLKGTPKLQNTCNLHPCHYAHQLAIKMSECVAVVDGIRPKLDQLTRTIWSLQRHLFTQLSPEHSKSPYDENEKVDKLIVKSILEITAKHPEITQAELAFHVHKRLVQFQSIIMNYSPSQIRKMLTALITEQGQFTSQRMEKVLEKIPYPIAKCLKNELAFVLIDSPELSTDAIIEEVFIFFQKAAAALKDLEDEEIERKIQNWTIQGDMLQRWIRLNHDSILFKEVEMRWKEPGNKSLQKVVARVYQDSLEKYPQLISYANELEMRIWIYLKYLWYTRGFGEETATFERFIMWHKQTLQPLGLSPHQLIEKIEMICRRVLPLMPFNRARAQTILVTEKENHS